MTIILVFGTSTTYGAWDSEGGWVQRLRKYLDNKQLEGKEHPTDPYYVIYNLGVSGDTSKDIIERLEFETKQRLKLKDEGEEIIILISVGVNDAIYYNKTKKNQVILDKFSSSVQKMINISKKYATNIVFVGNKPIDESKVDPIPWRMECSYKEIFVEKYDLKAAEICKKNDIPFIDVYRIFKRQDNYKKLLSDGVHPNNEGHKRIFEIVKKDLEKLEII